MYYSLSVDIVNTLEDLFDKNPTSSFCQNKLIFNDSVKKLPASNATKSGLMIKGIYYNSCLINLLFRHQAHLIPAVVVSLVKLKNAGTFQTIHDFHLALDISSVDKLLEIKF